MAPRDLLLALLVIVLWGINFVPTKFALVEISPLLLGALRFLLVALPLMLVIPLPRIGLRWLLLFALTQGVGQFGLLFFALKLGMTAALASVLMQTQIFITAMLGITLLKERQSRSLMIGMGVAGAGLTCFALEVLGDRGGNAGGGAGFLLTLCAAAMWASSNIVVKHVHKVAPETKPAALLVWSSLVTGLVFSALVLATESPAATWQSLAGAGLKIWLSILYAGSIAGGLAFWLWTLLLTRYPASQVAPFSLGVPVVGILAGIFILGEEVTRLQWLGSALVMLALLVVVIGGRITARKMARRYALDASGS